MRATRPSATLADMDWSPLTADVAPPIELRALLAEREGTWSNQLAVLDAALEVLAHHGVVPELAMTWAASPGASRGAVFAPGGVCVAEEAPTGIHTRWYPAEPLARSETTLPLGSTARAR